jgi:hypothetical protein
MFQTVKSKETRRHGGEHYTTEKNILKAIEPLFLDEYRSRLDTAWNDKGRLTELHNQLGRLRFLDPACGCGNFLIVAYRELREIELELLKRRRDLDLLDGTHTGGINRSQMTIDVTTDLKVTLDHFFGVEIEEWPARIAETAMLLVDHLANQRMEQDFGAAPDRLPIAIAPTIKHENALQIDWQDVVPAGDEVIILGNPPFSGRGVRDSDQIRDAKQVWGRQYNINLDYVTCWYLKAVRYFGSATGRWAFVSTNSVCQGEPVATLWTPILDAGWRCRFAHRSFQWESEAPGKATVTVSIVGFDRAKTLPKPELWTYAEGGQGEARGREVTRINPYLVEGPNLLVHKRTTPLNRLLPEPAFGSMPNDGGHLLVEPDDYAQVVADPYAVKYLRRFLGAKELLHNRERWCLWMVELDPADVRRSPILRERIEGTRLHRANSKSETTSTKNHPPHLFGQIAQPSTPYLAVPAHVSEHREYFAAAVCPPEVICGNANFLIPDPDGFTLGVVSSAMFIAWMKAIGGRLESRLRFSKTFTYNTFPLPEVSEKNRAAIVDAAREITEAREAHAGASLADLYNPGTTPSDVLNAHHAADRAVDFAFGSRTAIAGTEDRLKILFRSYAKLTNQESLV